MRVVLDTNALIRAHGRTHTRAGRLLEELLRAGHTFVLSNEIIVEVTKVLRYPRFQELYGLTEDDLLEYAQLLQSIAELVILDPKYNAPLRDTNDLIVLQTAELGEADILCSDDADFYDPLVLSYCSTRGIEICDELTLFRRLLPVN